MVITRNVAAQALHQSPEVFSENDRMSDTDDPEISFRSHNWPHADSLDFGSEEIGQEGLYETNSERRLRKVENAVQGINQKFDRLLSFLPSDTHQTSPRDRPDARSARAARPAPAPTPQPPANRHSRPTMNGQQDSTGGRDRPRGYPRREDLRGPAYQGYVAEQLRREELAAERWDDGKGIAPDILTKHLEPKPYMYVKRPGLETIKKKLEARPTLTFNEYVLVYIKMVRDPRANQNRDVYFHLEHLQHLAEDALARDWTCAREWSQETLDEIEKGSYTWEDQHIIQMERIKNALAAARSNPKPPAREDRPQPCRDFNGERGCTFPTHHGTGHARALHACTYCLTQTGRQITTHGRATCIRREVDAGVREPSQRNFSKNG